jgi:hypothetical protein
MVDVPGVVPSAGLCGATNGAPTALRVDHAGIFLLREIESPKPCLLVSFGVVSQRVVSFALHGARLAVFPGSVVPIALEQVVAPLVTASHDSDDRYVLRGVAGRHIGAPILKFVLSLAVVAPFGHGPVLLD